MALPANATGAHRIKVSLKPFQRLAGRGQRPRRDPQIAKLPQRSVSGKMAWEKPPLSKRGSLSYSESHPRSGYFFEDMQTQHVPQH